MVRKVSGKGIKMDGFEGSQKLEPPTWYCIVMKNKAPFKDTLLSDKAFLKKREASEHATEHEIKDFKVMMAPLPLLQKGILKPQYTNPGRNAFARMLYDAVFKEMGWKFKTVYVSIAYRQLKRLAQDRYRIRNKMEGLSLLREAEGDKYLIAWVTRKAWRLYYDKWGDSGRSARLASLRLNPERKRVSKHRRPRKLLGYL